MPADRHEWITRPGVDPFSAPRKPPLPPAEYDRRIEQGLMIERNRSITLRDGTEIYCDLYRPMDAQRDVPILLAWGPYGKHALSNDVFWPRSGVDPSWLSTLTPFEGPDPVWWGARGYGVAVVDPRGAWLSGGNFHHNGAQEAQDCADTIEWLGCLPWGNGRVGMSGVSYLAAIQYYVAPLRPEPLAALNPWEGFSDWYREFAYHGGIPETNFLPRASDNIRFSLNRTEDTWENAQAHPLFDHFWQSKEPLLEAIVQPAYVVASWSDQGLHLRGSIEAWRRMASKDKWLDIHGQKKWAHYYLDQSRKRRFAFFEHFMRDRPTTVESWPKVRIEVRDSHGTACERAESEWPLARTIYREFYLDTARGTLSIEPAAPSELRMDAVEGVTTFDLRFDQETEITGHAALTLWVETESSNDMDLFVALQKLDERGNEVGFTFYAFYENGPIALGWQRASHRALDDLASTPERPIHPHDREQLLEPGECVEVAVEIWPFSTTFKPGETLRLVVAGSDIYRPEEGVMLPFPLHENTRNKGVTILRSGGRHPSRLCLPFVPPQEGA
ncbi:CocE/NonD family hydrolase [Altererythrobacter sp.]|uniref:CocE/NonD family hydrolase n=1 Tax=Altererythrobacter sp. TaxID=1872480 RepID=UPI003D01F4B6